MASRKATAQGMPGDVSPAGPHDQWVLAATSGHRLPSPPHFGAVRACRVAQCGGPAGVCVARSCYKSLSHAGQSNDGCRSSPMVRIVQARRIGGPTYVTLPSTPVTIIGSKKKIAAREKKSFFRSPKRIARTTSGRRFAARSMRTSTIAKCCGMAARSVDGERLVYYPIIAVVEWLLLRYDEYRQVDDSRAARSRCGRRRLSALPQGRSGASRDRRGDSQRHWRSGLGTADRHVAHGWRPCDAGGTGESGPAAHGRRE